MNPKLREFKLKNLKNLNIIHHTRIYNKITEHEFAFLLLKIKIIIMKCHCDFRNRNNIWKIWKFFNFSWVIISSAALLFYIFLELCVYYSYVFSGFYFYRILHNNWHWNFSSKFLLMRYSGVFHCFQGMFYCSRQSFMLKFPYKCLLIIKINQFFIWFLTVCTSRKNFFYT